MASFREWARSLPEGLSLRDETTADREFLADLYASTRAEELRPVAWTETQKRTFLRGQFELQWAHYRRHYPRAEWLVIVRGGAAIGRLYVHTGPAEVRLMDLALLAEQRRQGLGAGAMHSLLDYADTLRLPVGLHVEPFNPALRLYERLGFRTRETRGIYLFLERAPSLAEAPGAQSFG